MLLLLLFPQGMASRCSGDCMTGEPCTLPMPGLTARRLMLTGSRSSSPRRRLLLLMRRVISAALGAVAMGFVMNGAAAVVVVVCVVVAVVAVAIMVAVVVGGPSGVPLPELLLVVVLRPGMRNGLLLWPWLAPPLELAWEGDPMLTSSKERPDEDARAKPKEGGGGVTRWVPPPTLLVSEKVSQKTLPLEPFMACCLNVPVRPRALALGSIIIITSSVMSSRLSCVSRLGLERAVEAVN